MTDKTDGDRDGDGDEDQQNQESENLRNSRFVQFDVFYLLTLMSRCSLNLIYFTFRYKQNILKYVKNNISKLKTFVFGWMFDKILKVRNCLGGVDF